MDFDKTEGKIIKGVGGLYRVLTENGTAECRPRGALRKTNLKPVIGDACVISGSGGAWTIESISERRNELTRPRVSNIDAVVAVCAADSPNLYLLDKYLIILGEQAAAGSFQIIVLINKTDLADKNEISKIKKDYGRAGYPTVFFSALKKTGTDELLGLIRGRTAALAGVSGVGKSSVVNLLCGGTVMETGGLSKKISRGKHTTRHAEMFPVDGGFVIDTPGFASLNFDNASRGTLKNFFADFNEFTAGCRYADCAHIGEPDCGVKAQAGKKLSASRYGNYLRLYNEISV